MKVRIAKGFVTNSSSSCFILSLKDAGVKQILKEMKELFEYDYIINDDEIEENDLRARGYTFYQEEDTCGGWKITHYRKLCKTENITNAYGRQTAYGVGKDVLKYVEMMEGSYSGIDGWLQGWLHEIGEENIVLIRVSDEGMGGDVDNELMSRIVEKSYESKEYH